MALQMNLVDSETGATINNAYIVVEDGFSKKDGRVIIHLRWFASEDARNATDIPGKPLVVECQSDGPVNATDMKNLAYQLVKQHPDFNTAVDV